MFKKVISWIRELLLKIVKGGFHLKSRNFIDTRHFLNDKKISQVFENMVKYINYCLIIIIKKNQIELLFY